MVWDNFLWIACLTHSLTEVYETASSSGSTSLWSLATMDAGRPLAVVPRKSLRGASLVFHPRNLRTLHTV